MTMTINPTCTTCAGTGEDPDFGGTCSMCEGFIPRRGGMGETLRARQWSPTPTRRASAMASDEWKLRPRWTKVGDQFFVVVPKNITASTGDTLTVTSKNGEKPVTLGAMFDRDNYGGTLYAPAYEAREPRAAASVIDEGFYLHDGTVYRVVTSKAGRPYAKELVGHKFEYAAGAIKELSADERVTAEVAAAYGHETNHCLFCGRELENPESVARGIGPVCFAKYC